MNDYKIKYYKYINKNNIKYYFNSYGKEIPRKYTILLNMLNLKNANNKEYLSIRKHVVNNISIDYNDIYKLTVGSSNMIFTLFNDDCIINFVITEDNTCYIETFCGFSQILLNCLKTICYEYGISKIETFTNYQPLQNFLLENNFIQDKNRYLVFPVPSNTKIPKGVILV